MGYLICPLAHVRMSKNTQYPFYGRIHDANLFRIKSFNQFTSTTSKCVLRIKMIKRHYIGKSQ